MGMAPVTAQSSNQARVFGEIVDLHQRAVYRYLVRCTGNSDDAQELFQETFLRAYRAYADLPTDANHRAWLFRIATNLVKNYIRGRQRYRKVFVADAPLPSPGPHPATPEQTVHSRETARVVLNALRALPFKQRTALIQRQLEGFAYREIAENLACSEDSARAHVYQALKKLRADWQRSTTGEERREHANPKA